MISSIYGKNEESEVIQDYGKAEVLLHFGKKVCEEVTLKLRTEGVSPANSLWEAGDALQCEQLVYDELKGCLEMSRGRVE